METFISDLSLWFGIGIGLLTILDFLLRSKHKNWIRNKSETFWFWLDGQNILSSTESLIQINPRLLVLILWKVRLLALVGFSSCYIIYTSYFVPGSIKPDISAIIIEFVISILSLSICTYINSLIIEKLKIGILNDVKLSRNFIVYYLFVLIFLVFGLLISSYFDINVHSNYWRGHFLFDLILLSITVVLFADIFKGMVDLLFAFTWYLIVLLLKAAYQIIKYIALIITENPKGPTIALSILLTCIGLIMKILLT